MQTKCSPKGVRLSFLCTENNAVESSRPLWSRQEPWFAEFIRQGERPSAGRLNTAAVAQVAFLGKPIATMVAFVTTSDAQIANIVPPLAPS